MCARTRSRRSQRVAVAPHPCARAGLRTAHFKMAITATQCPVPNLRGGRSSRVETEKEGEVTPILLSLSPEPAQRLLVASDLMNTSQANLHQGPTREMNLGGFGCGEISGERGAESHTTDNTESITFGSAVLFSGPCVERKLGLPLVSSIRRRTGDRSSLHGPAKRQDTRLEVKGHIPPDRFPTRAARRSRLGDR
jgi:hypothetical protein